MQQLNNYKEVLKDDVTSIYFRFLEIKDDDSWVIKKDEDYQDGYYEYYIKKDELQTLLDGENAKEDLYSYFAIDYNRPFMEFLINNLFLESSYLVSIMIPDDDDKEYSYLASEYMDETYLYDSVRNLYDEEFGMMSDFDYYPYGLFDIHKSRNLLKELKKS